MDLSNFIIELACLKIKLICSDKLREKQLYVSKIKSWNVRLKNWYVSQCDSDQKNYYPKITSLITDVSDFMDEYSKTVESGATDSSTACDASRSDAECKPMIQQPAKNEILTLGQQSETQSPLSACSQKYFSNAVQHRVNNTVYTDQPSVKIWRIAPDQNTVQVLSVAKSDCNETYFNNLLSAELAEIGGVAKSKKKKHATLSFNMKTRAHYMSEDCLSTCDCCMSYTVLFQDPSETKSMKVNRTMGKFFANAPFFGTPENLRGVYLIYIQKYTSKGFCVYDMTITPADFKKFVHQYRDDMIGAARL